jgi:hypothetical protein
MDILQQASELLRPLMDAGRRDTWLSLAFHDQHRDIYDSIDQSGATREFTLRCVRNLLERGFVGSRHSLSLLLEVVRRYAGDEKQADFCALLRALDALGERPPDADCPYRDLRAFREEDQPVFFGRDAFTSELVAAVDRQPFVAVVGASGSGKSSVAQAGLIPVLRARGGWAVGILRPGPEPWRSLAACLLELIEGEPSADERVKRVIATGKLAARLAVALPTTAKDGSCVALRHLVDATLAAHPGSSRVLLVVDQWEELYTYPQTTPTDAAAFADRLVEAAQHAPLSVVLTLRADFTGRAIEHRPLRDRLQQATVFLGGMTRAERERAISGPAQVAGLRFEPGLVGRLLDDIGDEPGNLPLLEFCLTQLYARSRDGTLCQAAFEAIGGVRGAIVQRADSVIDAMESEHPGRAAMARDIFLQLVQLGEGSEDTRRRAPLVDFDDVARALIDELATARLLVTGRDPGSATETVEVAHEALIRNWPRLQEWLQEDRADLHRRREIGRATLDWQAHGDSYRWPDERVIRETAPMLQRLGSRFELNDAERDFLGPLAAEKMLALLDEASTPQALRAQIGDRLALLPGGDPRPGVGRRCRRPAGDRLARDSGRRGRTGHRGHWPVEALARSAALPGRAFPHRPSSADGRPVARLSRSRRRLRRTGAQDLSVAAGSATRRRQPAGGERHLDRSDGLLRVAFCGAWLCRPAADGVGVAAGGDRRRPAQRVSLGRVAGRTGQHVRERIGPDDCRRPLSARGKRPGRAGPCRQYLGMVSQQVRHAERCVSGW